MVVYMMFVGYSKIPFLTILNHQCYSPLWLLIAFSQQNYCHSKILWYPLLTWFEMGCRRLGDYAWCLVQAGKGNLFFIFLSTNSVCTLRGSYGKSKGRCLIRVPTGPQHSTCKFPHQMALVKCPSAFRLPGSHKVWARSCDQSSTSTSSSSTPQHHLSSYPGIPTNPTMTRPKVELLIRSMTWPSQESEYLPASLTTSRAIHFRPLSRH